MEKPAVVFSEQGFKIFLDFIDMVYTGRESAGNGLNLHPAMFLDELHQGTEKTDCEGQMSLDDEEFFDAYDEFKGIKKPADPDKPKKRIRRPKPDGIVTPRKTFEESREEYEVFKNFLINNGSTKLDAIWQYMNEKGQWEFPAKQASSRVKTLNKYFGGIERVGVGIYRMRG